MVVVIVPSAAVDVVVVFPTASVAVVVLVTGASATGAHHQLLPMAIYRPPTKNSTRLLSLNLLDFSYPYLSYLKFTFNCS